MSKKELVCLSLILIVAGVAGRLLPHPWNATPLTAITLFASAYLGLRYSSIVVLTVLVASDMLLGLYQWQIMLSVYASMILVGMIGYTQRKKRTVSRTTLSALGASLVFFFVTNWAVWQFGTMYPHTWYGLFESYFMALPFFKNALLGDLVYTGTLFGIFELVRRRYCMSSPSVITPHPLLPPKLSFLTSRMHGAHR